MVGFGAREDVGWWDVEQGSSYEGWGVEQGRKWGGGILRWLDVEYMER